MLSISFSFTSCDDLETENISKITYYPDFVITGGEYYRHQVGTSFTDPGYTAFEGENELDVTATGSVDSDTPGIYELNYSATNVDGFDGSAKRFVIVTDELDDSGVDMSGTYQLVHGSLVIFDIVVKKDEKGYYNMPSLYAYEYTYGMEYKMPVKFVYVSDGHAELVPMLDLWSNYLTSKITIHPNGDLEFPVFRNGSYWSSRYWKKL